MKLDHTLSHSLFRLAHSSWTVRHLAVFAGRYVIWIMVGVLLMAFVWNSEARTVVFRVQTLFLLFLLPPLTVTMLLSKFVNRPRPFEELKEQPLIEPFVETASFPSGHATLAFAMLTLGGLLFPGLVPYLLIGAVVVALGRVAVGVHYVSDIIVGALVGIGITPLAMAIIMVAFGYD